MRKVIPILADFVSKLIITSYFGSFSLKSYSAFSQHVSVPSILLIISSVRVSSVPVVLWCLPIRPYSSTRLATARAEASFTIYALILSLLLLRLVTPFCDIYHITLL
ncbi:hypothetical protein C8J57DRAFT_663154 [Mycena rebaudengoi]|nr:hypothetical protein C8J57DRAFT_663154 [Mycena rebaudengoi]